MIVINNILCYSNWIHDIRKLWERYIEVCRDSNSLKGMSWSQLRSHLDALEMKKLYGLNPMAPEFVPKVLQAGQPLIMASHHFHPVRLPPFFPPPAPPPSAPPTVAGFPSFPPPPPFHPQPQWLLTGNLPHRQPQIVPSRNIRTQILPMHKIPRQIRPPSVPPIPPPVVHLPHGHPPPINAGSSMPPSYPQPNTAFQVNRLFGSIDFYSLFT